MVPKREGCAYSMQNITVAGIQDGSEGTGVHDFKGGKEANIASRACNRDVTLGVKGPM